ncbi:hypothetical protein Tco_1053482 [Tanacetum coccineum]|uniref:Uncharacterized protein n=1 Tax=Tanacetum coccineum TaxID=301880 RepID=A0ABQ5GU10_9ASTR
MVAPVISILSDLSEESVGSHALRVILFGVIPAIIPVIPKVPIISTDPMVAPEVGVVYVLSPTEALDLVDYLSSFDSDPSEDSLPPVPELPLVSPFLYSDDSEADSESEPVEQRPERHKSLAVHDDMVSRKRVGPIPTRRLAWRRASHHLSDCHSSPDSTSDSSTFGSYSDSSSDTSSGSSSYSLSGSSSVHSSGCDSSGQAHLEPSTRVASPRSSTASIPSSTHVSRSIAPTLADLLPPRKRFRD